MKTVEVEVDKKRTPSETEHLKSVHSCLKLISSSREMLGKHDPSCKIDVTAERLLGFHHEEDRWKARRRTVNHCVKFQDIVEEKQGQVAFCMQQTRKPTKEACLGWEEAFGKGAK